MKFKVEKIRRIDRAARKLRSLLAFLASTLQRTLTTPRPLFSAGGLRMGAVGAVALGAAVLTQPASAVDIATTTTDTRFSHFWITARAGGHKAVGGGDVRITTYLSVIQAAINANEVCNFATLNYVNTRCVKGYDTGSEQGCVIDWQSTALVRDSVRSTYNYGTLSNLTVARTGLWNYGTFTTANLTVQGLLDNNGKADISTLANNGIVSNSGEMTLTTYSGLGSLTNNSGALINIAGGQQFTAGAYNGSILDGGARISITDSDGTVYAGDMVSGIYTASATISETAVVNVTGTSSKPSTINIDINSKTYTGLINQTTGAYTAVATDGTTVTGTYDFASKKVSGVDNSTNCVFSDAPITLNMSISATDTGSGTSEIYATLDADAGTVTGTVSEKEINGTYNATSGAITFTDADGHTYSGAVAADGTVSITGNSLTYSGSTTTDGSAAATASGVKTVTGERTGNDITVVESSGATYAGEVTGGTTFTGVTTNAGTINSENSAITISGTYKSKRDGTLNTVGFTMADDSTFQVDADYTETQATCVTADAVTIGDNVTLDITSMNNGSKEIQTIVESGTPIVGGFSKVCVAGVVVDNAELTLRKFINTVTMTVNQDRTRITISNPNGLVWNTTIVNEATGEVQAHGDFYIETSYTLQNDLYNNALCAGNRGFMGWNGDTLTKTGPGILYLTGNNMYTGNTIIKEGTLSINGDARIGGSDKLILDGGYLNPTGDLLTTNIYLNAGGFNVTVNAAYGGQIIGDADLYVIGTNNDKKLTLTAEQTSHSGDTIIQGGMLSIGADSIISRGALVLDGGALELTGLDHRKNILLTAASGEISTPGIVNYSGVISGEGGLTKKGMGTLVVTGDNLYSGATTVREGTLLQTRDWNTAANITTNPAGNYQVDANVVVHNDMDSATINNFGQLTVNDNRFLTADNINFETNSVLNVGVNTRDRNEALVQAGNVTIGPGAIINLQTENWNEDSVLVKGNFGSDRFSTFSVNGVDQAGALTVNDYINRATLAYDEAAQTITYIASTGLVWDNDYLDAGATTYQAHGNFNIGTGSNVRITQDIADNGVIAANFALDGSDPEKKATLDGLWNGRTLTKLGEGTLTLSGNNTYTGGTIIKGGTLAAASSANLGTGSITLDGGMLDMCGIAGTVYNNNIIVTDLGGSIASSNTVTLTGSIAAEDDGDEEFGNLYKDGSGIIIVTGLVDPEIRNRMYIKDGTLVLAQDGLDLALLNIGAGSTAIINSNVHDDLENSGTLIVNPGFTLTADNATFEEGSITTLNRGSLIAVTNNITVNGGTLNIIDPVNTSGVKTTLITWGGTANFSGPTQPFTSIAVNGNVGGVTADQFRNPADVTVEDNAIVYTAKGLVWNNTRTSNPGMAAHGYFNVGADSVTLSDVLADNGDVDPDFAIDDWDGKSLTKRGIGTLTLTGANTYTGTTTVETGTLELASEFTSTGGFDIRDGGRLLLSAPVVNNGSWTNAGTAQFNAGGSLAQAGGMASGSMFFNGGFLKSTGTINVTGDLSFNLNNYKYQGQGGASKGSNAIITANKMDYTGGKITISGGLPARTYEIIRSADAAESAQLAAAFRAACGNIWTYRFDNSDPFLYTVFVSGGTDLSDYTPTSGLGGVIGQIANDPDAAAKIQDILDVLNGLEGDDLKRALAELDNQNMTTAQTSAMSQSIDVQITGLVDVLTDDMISNIAMDIYDEYGGGSGGMNDKDDDSRENQRRKKKKSQNRAAAGGAPVYLTAYDEERAAAGGYVVMSNYLNQKKGRAVRKTPAARPAAQVAQKTTYVYQDGTAAAPCPGDCGSTHAPASAPAKYSKDSKEYKKRMNGLKAWWENNTDPMAHRYSTDGTRLYKGFLKGLGGFGDSAKNSVTAGFANNYAGVLGGIYREISPEIRLGGVVGYTHMDMYLHDRFGEANDNAIRVSALGQYRWNRLFFNTAPGVGVHMIDSNRNLSMFGRNARNQRTGFDFAWMNQLGYVLNYGKTLFTPTFSITPIMMHTPRYTEGGAGTANLSVADCVNWRILQTLDLRISRVFCFNGVRIMPELRAGWEHRYLSNQSIHQSFEVLPSYGWTAETEDDIRNKAVFGASVTAIINQNLDFNAKWEEKVWDGGYQCNFNLGGALKF